MQFTHLIRQLGQVNTLNRTEIDKLVKNLSKFDAQPNYNQMAPYKATVKDSEELRRAEQFKVLVKEIDDKKNRFKVSPQKQHSVDVSNSFHLISLGLEEFLGPGSKPHSG